LDLSHEPDYINHFFEKPKSIAGMVRNTGSLGIAEEEIGSAVVEFAGGGMGTIALDYLSRRTTRRLVISCRKGEVEYDFVGKRIIVLKANGNKTFEVKREGDCLYEAEDREFLSVVAGGKRKKLATFIEAVDVLRIVDSWKKSSALGKKVRIEYAG